MTRIARLISVLVVCLLLPLAVQSQTPESGQKLAKLPKRFQPLEKSNLWDLVSVFGNDQWVDDEAFGDVAVSKNGKWGLSGNGRGTIRLWDLSTGDCVRILRKGTFYPAGLGFLPGDNFIFVADIHGKIDVIEILTGLVVRKNLSKFGSTKVGQHSGSF